MKKILFFLIISSLSFGQDPFTLDSNLEFKKDRYIEYFNEDLILRVGVLSQNLDIGLYTDAQSTPLIYKPNTKKLLSTKITYKNLSLAYIFDPGFSTKDDEMTPSNYTDLSLISDFGNHAIELNYQNYKGFYTEQSPHFDESLESEKYTLNYYFKLSKKFSFDAVFNLNEKQIKSYGTYMFVVSPELYRINNDLVYINQSKATKDKTINSVDFYSLALGPGVAYTFSKSNFYLSFMFFYALGAQRGEYEFNGDKYDSSDMLAKSNTKIGFGYNSRRFFTGAYFNSTQTDYTIDSLNMSTKNTTFEVFIGGRI